MCATRSINKLTDTACRKVLPAERTQKLADGAGLYLEVTSAGGKYWRLKYRVAGIEKRLAFGVYPDVSLAQARARRDEARRALAAGDDPGAIRKDAKAAAVATAAAAAAAARGEALPGTFKAVATEWLCTVHQAKVSTGHAERTRIRFEQDVFPWIGSRPIDAVDAPELLAALRRIVARGAIETAHRAKDACGQVFRYGIAAGHCKRNPAADLRDALPPVPTRHMAAIVDPKQAGELLRDMVGYVGHPVTRSALALSALLMLRPGELRQMEWAWVDFDAATLTVPSSLMKRSRQAKANGAPHVVPLVPQALAILRDLQPLTATRGGGRYVFPSMLSAHRPMSDNTVRVALRRMGYGNDDMTAHGFRAMARTLIAERLGVPAEVIEAQLAHSVPDALGRAYNRTQFLEQRRQMMQAWADYLDRLRDGAQVIPIAGKAAA